MEERQSRSTLKVVSLPGDGIGPEVMKQGLDVLAVVTKALGIEARVETIPCGGRFFLEHGERDWPEGSEEKCGEADLILLGAVGHVDERTGDHVTLPNGKMAGWSPVIGNRCRLGLFANVRPVKLYPGVMHRISNRRDVVWKPEHVDMVFVRENTEDLYAGIGGVLETRGRSHIASDTRIITREASERVIRFALDLARNRSKGAPEDGRKRVTCIVKDNVLRGCALFAEVFREVGDCYPDVDQEKVLVDAFTQALVTCPERYDVCVTTNMFGDIVTDLASVLQGGMGLSVGCNIGDGHGMFEPIHGSAPALAGKGIANPMAMILAVGEGLRWLGRKRDCGDMTKCADRIEQSVAAVLSRGHPLTRDLASGGEAATTATVGEAVRRELESRLSTSSAGAP